jgi:uncharacterized membrane protein
VVGSYATREEAEEVLELLAEHKFPSERLMIRAQSSSFSWTPHPSRRRSRHQSALIGAVLGALIGGVLGLVLSLSLLTVPGLLLGALLGALLGSAADAAEGVLDPVAADAADAPPTAYALLADREIAAAVRGALAESAARR